MPSQEAHAATAESSRGVAAGGSVMSRVNEEVPDAPWWVYVTAPIFVAVGAVILLGLAFLIWEMWVYLVNAAVEERA